MLKKLWQLGEIKLVSLIGLGTFLSYSWVGLAGRDSMPPAFLTLTTLATLTLLVQAHRLAKARKSLLVPKGSLLGLEYLFYAFSRSSFWQTISRYKLSFLAIWLWGLGFYPVYALLRQAMSIWQTVADPGFIKVLQKALKDLVFKQSMDIKWQEPTWPALLPHLIFVVVLSVLTYSVYLRLQFAHLDSLVRVGKT